MPDVQLTWLGHATFRFDSPGGKRIYVDPWLTNPKCPEGEKEPERVDVIAITHGHDDHVGNTIDLAEKHGCTVVAPVELADWLVWMKKAVSEDNIRDPNKGGTVDLGGVKVTLTHAQHSSSTIDDDHMVYLGEPVGLVFEVENGTKIYFAGDTNVFGDMQLIKRLYAPDVAVLPIGGHYTMDRHDAVQAVDLVGAPAVIPCHYDTFPPIEADAEAFKADVEDQTKATVTVLEPGDTSEL